LPPSLEPAVTLLFVTLLRALETVVSLVGLFSRPFSGTRNFFDTDCPETDGARLLFLDLDGLGLIFLLKGDDFLGGV